MKVFFKNNLFIWFLYFEIQQLKRYLRFIFPMFDPNLIQNDFLFEYGVSIVISLSINILRIGHYLKILVKNIVTFTNHSSEAPPIYVVL